MGKLNDTMLRPKIIRWVIRNKKDIVLNILTLGIYGVLKLIDRWAPPGNTEKESEELIEETKETGAGSSQKKKTVSDDQSVLTLLFFAISGLVLILTELPLGGLRGPGYAFANLAVVLIQFSLIPGLISFLISRAWKKNFWFILSIFFLIQAILHLGVYILESAILTGIEYR